MILILCPPLVARTTSPSTFSSKTRSMSLWWDRLHLAYSTKTGSRCCHAPIPPECLASHLIAPLASTNSLEGKIWSNRNISRTSVHLVITKGAPSVKVPPSNLHSHYGDLLSSKQGADVEFMVRGEIFTAHRLVLAARSPVLRRSSSGHWRKAPRQMLYRLMVWMHRCSRLYLSLSTWICCQRWTKKTR